MPRRALDFSGEKVFYWSYQNNRAERIEVQTGVSDEEWVEVTKRRPAGLGEKIAQQSKTQKGAKEAVLAAETKSWTPIDGSEQVILGQLDILADREPVRLAQEDEEGNDQDGQAQEEPKKDDS